MPPSSVSDSPEQDTALFDAEEEAATPDPSQGALYVVGTPIGNLEDITLRALRTLREADLIAAEDTRVTRKLLSHYDISTPSTSYHQHSAGGKALDLANRIAAGARIALVSDAGMPGVSDPGWELIGLCIERGLSVVPIPGPTAVTTALAGSGLPTQRFAFDGFPPRQRKNRVVFFERLRHETRTVILYESPRRLRETLMDLQETLGPDRRIVACRELTKWYEEFQRGTLAEVLRVFEERTPRGEFALVIEGAPSVVEAASPPSPEALREMTSRHGAHTKELAEQLAGTGMSKKQAYRLALQLRETSPDAPDSEGGLATDAPAEKDSGVQ